MPALPYSAAADIGVNLPPLVERSFATSSIFARIFGELGGEWTIVFARGEWTATLGDKEVEFVCGESATGVADEGSLKMLGRSPAGPPLLAPLPEAPTGGIRILLRPAPGAPIDDGCSRNVQKIRPTWIMARGRTPSPTTICAKSLSLSRSTPIHVR